MTLKYFSKKTGKEFHGFYSEFWVDKVSLNLER